MIRNEVLAPASMHRHIIGKKETAIQQIIQDFLKVRILQNSTISVNSVGYNGVAYLLCRKLSLFPL